MYYEPAEDSFLLASYIAHYPAKRILDMGTGSGILADIAKREHPTAQVFGVDINPCAHVGDGVTFIQSDMFSCVGGTFDLIICNPPYLPAHSLDPDDLRTRALVGGQRGYEFILRLLSQVRTHLATNGVLLLLFSSLSKKQVIDKAIRKNLLVARQLAYKNVGLMEYLYVYEIKPLWQLEYLSHVQQLTFYKKGRRGYILTGMLSGEKVAIKITNPQSQVDSLQKEILMLRKVNAHGIGPRLIEYGTSYIIMEFIEGEPIIKKQPSVNQIRDIFEQLFTLDQLGIEKKEMNHPHKHILLGKRVVLIDFERAIFKDHPKNVTQFAQFIGIRDKNALKQYKELQTHDALLKLLKSYEN